MKKNEIESACVATAAKLTAALVDVEAGEAREALKDAISALFDAADEIREAQ